MTREHLAGGMTIVFVVAGLGLLTGHETTALIIVGVCALTSVVVAAAEDQKLEVNEEALKRDRSVYDQLVELYGPDPGAWPSWVCLAMDAEGTPCEQRHSGWSIDCGRCGAERPVPFAPPKAPR